MAYRVLGHPSIVSWWDRATRGVFGGREHLTCIHKKVQAASSSGSKGPVVGGPIFPGEE
jgi:hypothetical protein